MALRLQILGFALGSLLVSRAYPAGFTIAAVGAFGEELSNCRVDNFRLSNGETGTRSEYKDGLPCQRSSRRGL